MKYLGEKGFVGCVSWEILSKSLEHGKSFIIYPIHEKVYILYDNFIKHMNDMLGRYQWSNAEESEAAEQKRRTLLVDNREVKRFLREHMVDDKEAHENVQEEARRILSMDLPHYLWCCEYSMPMGNLLFIANPTYIRRTTKNIFLNKDLLICKSQISLLRYDD